MRLLAHHLLSIGLAATLGLGAAPARADGTSSRWIAALPFGAGQFHNGDTGLGIFFAAGEGLLGGASIAMAILAGRLASAPMTTTGGRTLDIPAVNRELTTLTMVNRVTFAGWAALTAAGVLDAQVRFVPRRCEKRCPAVTAGGAPVPGGGLVAVRATF